MGRQGVCWLWIGTDRLRLVSENWARRGKDRVARLEGQEAFRLSIRYLCLSINRHLRSLLQTTCRLGSGTRRRELGIPDGRYARKPYPSTLIFPARIHRFISELRDLTRLVITRVIERHHRPDRTYQAQITYRLVTRGDRASLSALGFSKSTYRTPYSCSVTS